MRKRKEATLGFTLTELLIVIAIIGVLAALSTAAVIAARTAIINSLVRSQMSQMEIALEKYKADFGEYPPSLTDEDATIRHARMRWKRANVTYAEIMNYAFAQPLDNLTVADRSPFRNSANDATKVTNFLDRSLAVHHYESAQLRSLTFWLGGMYDPQTKTFLGFSADPANPLQRPLDSPQREQPRFEFTEAHFALQEFTDANFTYTDVAGATGEKYPFQVPYFAVRGYPIVYFRASGTGDSLAYMKVDFPIGSTTGTFPDICDLTSLNPNFGVAVPYARSGEPINTNWNAATWLGTSTTGYADKVVWYNADKYQLIYPGFDMLFGEPSKRKSFPESGAASAVVDAAVKSWFATTGPVPTPGVSPVVGIVTDQGITVEDLDNVTNFTKGTTLNSVVK